MRITRKNFEAFLLDYHEGTLDPQGIKELALFLEVNPDLAPLINEKADVLLDGFELPSFAGKEKLRRKVAPVGPVSEQNIEEYLIGRLEGINSDTQEKDLDAFLQVNPAYTYDLELFRKTLLEPDTGIVYMNKDHLKKKPGITYLRKAVFYVAAAAAVAILFFGSAYLFRQPTAKQASIALTKESVEMQVTAGSVIIKPITPFRKREAVPLYSVGANSGQSEELIPLADREKIAPVLIEPVIARLETEAAEASDYSMPARDEPAAAELTKTESRSGLIGKILANLVLKTRDVLAEKTDRKEVTPGDGTSGFWKMASAGLRGYNALTDKDLALELNRDQSGRITSYRVTDHDQVFLSRSKQQD